MVRWLTDRHPGRYRSNATGAPCTRDCYEPHCSFPSCSGCSSRSSARCRDRHRRTARGVDGDDDDRRRARVRQAQGPRRRLHPRPGCLRDQRGGGDKPVPGVTITVEDDQGKEVGEGRDRRHGHLRPAAPGHHDRHPRQDVHVKIDTDTLPEGTALPNPKQVSLKQTVNLDDDVFVTFPIGDEPGGRQQVRRRRSQLFVGGIVFSLLLAHGGARPVDDLRHHRADELRPRRADHLRRDRRVLASTRLPGDITIGGPNVTFLVGVVVGVHRLRRLRLGQRQALWKPLRQPRHRPDRDDDRHIGLSIFLRNFYQYFAGATNQQLLAVLGSAQPYRHRPDRCSPPKTCWSCADRDDRPGRDLPRAAAHPDRQGHPRGRRQPGAGAAVRHRRRAGHPGRLDRRRGARRPGRRPARADPGRQLPARLQDPAADLRRRHARRPRHDLGRPRRQRS